LAAVLEDHQLSQIEVSLGKLNIRLKAGKISEAVVVNRVDAKDEPAVEEIAETGHVVTAPMIGTFYASPSPGEPPFVSVGDSVETGQVIGIIEAMKIMNEIAADRSGTISEVFAANAQPVEYGSPLIRIN
ncbi:MAG: acetyl-CoA carboxylase biotin carboxyl carrier protein, partial [Bdellovibrionales bacterium]|nr:acetyl-CoA carboxylase biotin carboxyl carrier protein [Bdellovibrionales bacterium]